jgi:hypothetical protein
MTLLAAHPAVAAKKAGRAAESNVAPENLAFVEREWTKVDGLITAVNQRINK